MPFSLSLSLSLARKEERKSGLSSAKRGCTAKKITVEIFRVSLALSHFVSVRAHSFNLLLELDKFPWDFPRTKRREKLDIQYLPTTRPNQSLESIRY